MKKRNPQMNKIYKEAAVASLTKLDPKALIKNPVMFAVYICAILTSFLFVIHLNLSSHETLFELQIAIWLWLTVIFGNFAEAVAEGRAKAEADSMRMGKKDAKAKKLDDGELIWVNASSLRKGDIIQVVAGEIIPTDGEIIEGMASIDESVVTGESAPVIRESGGDRSSVVGGTKVLSDVLKIKVATNPGESFLDRMISLVEGAKRRKTPNEIALTILLVGLSLIFLIVTLSIYAYGVYSKAVISVAVLSALFVCLAPTTIGALLSAIGIAGMDRLLSKNVLALSGKAVETAGDIDVLLLDKTGTITYGNRMATEMITAYGVSPEELARYAALASASDETPEGRSVYMLANSMLSVPVQQIDVRYAVNIPFSANTRTSGVDLPNESIRKGAVDSIAKFVNERNGQLEEGLTHASENVARMGATPLLVAANNRVLGLIVLKDVVKPGIKEKFARLRAMGIKTVMITGDNPLTAAAIVAESGVDDFVAQATPETKLELLKSYQSDGKLVAMTGDGTNDAPALAQADVGVAMNSGTQAAKEAANMIDLDSDPTKLLAIVETGKQMLVTRGAITTFSIANDVAKFFAIIPAMFAVAYPELSALNIMGLGSAHSAILSAVIFNAIIIILLVPLAMRGASVQATSHVGMLKRNLLIYGLGGIVAPFAGIWAIDKIVGIVGLV